MALNILCFSHRLELSNAASGFVDLQRGHVTAKQILLIKFNHHPGHSKKFSIQLIIPTLPLFDLQVKRIRNTYILELSRRVVTSKINRLMRTRCPTPVYMWKMNGSRHISLTFIWLIRDTSNRNSIWQRKKLLHASTKQRSMFSFQITLISVANSLSL